MARRSRNQVFDSLYVGALVLYVMAGMALAPFHGDESTTIYVSHDWYTLILDHNLPAVLYRDLPADPKAAADQELRLLNGVVSKYAIGFMASMAGIPVTELNDQWLWGADWNYNRDTGHIPGDRLLFVARLSSTLMTALSVAGVFAMARRLGGRGPAWLAAFFYASLPAVLLNGRHAVYEGATLLAISLVILAGLQVARRSLSIRRWLILGILSGLALATKHSMLITVVPVFGMLIGLGRHDLRRTVAYTTGAVAIAAGVFFALNPAWWSAPLQVPREVLRLRQRLLSDQVAYFGGYTNMLDRVDALVRQPLGDPQYYEDQRGWPQWIGSQIAAYEASGLAGIHWGILAYLSIPFGVLALLMMPRSPGLVLLAGVSIFTVLAVFSLTPLAWQRYYLPLAAPVAVLCGLGVLSAWRRLWSKCA
jgi:4-amino-4-deoxy-L-arabinose transferase-like glycosyltransferase